MRLRRFGRYAGQTSLVERFRHHWPNSGQPFVFERKQKLSLSPVLDLDEAGWLGLSLATALTSLFRAIPSDTEIFRV